MWSYIAYEWAILICKIFTWWYTVYARNRLCRYKQPWYKYRRNWANRWYSITCFSIHKIFLFWRSTIVIQLSVRLAVQSNRYYDALVLEITVQGTITLLWSRKTTDQISVKLLPRIHKLQIDTVSSYHSWQQQSRLATPRLYQFTGINTVHFQQQPSRLPFNFKGNTNLYLHPLLKTFDFYQCLLEVASTLLMSNGTTINVVEQTTIVATIPPAHTSRMRNWFSPMTSRMISTPAKILHRIQAGPTLHIANRPHSAWLAHR